MMLSRVSKNLPCISQPQSLVDPKLSQCSGSLLLKQSQVWVYDAQETDEYECVALLQSHTQDTANTRRLLWDSV